MSIALRMFIVLFTFAVPECSFLRSDVSKRADVEVRVEVTGSYDDSER